MHLSFSRKETTSREKQYVNSIKELPDEIESSGVVNLHARDPMNYNDWWYRRAYVLVPVQEQVAKVIETLKEFPPRQKPSSFTVGDALEALSAPIAPGR